MLDRVSEPGASIREDDRIVLLCGMWSLWNTRNDYHHGKKPINPALAIDWATDACYHLLIVQQNTRRGPTTRADNWQPPPEGVVKLNCDGGFQAAEMKGSTGAVLRTSDGSFLAASARCLSSTSSALVIEAEACRDGLRLALNMGEIRDLIMETDSLQLVSLWNSRRQQLSEIAVILQDIEEMVQPLTSFCFAHVTRSANNVAHLCAKQASQSRPSLLWQDHPPSFLLSSL